MKVLVLEKHSERGGQTHIFRRDGASWDVGLHYVGELDKGSIIRTVIDFLSGGALEWNRMTDEFERFLYPGLAFRRAFRPARATCSAWSRAFPTRRPRSEAILATCARSRRGMSSASNSSFCRSHWRSFSRNGAGSARPRRPRRPRIILRRHFRSPRAQSLARIAMGRLWPAARPKRVRAARPRRRQLSQRRIVSSGRRRAHRAHV